MMDEGKNAKTCKNNLERSDPEEQTRQNKANRRPHQECQKLKTFIQKSNFICFSLGHKFRMTNTEPAGGNK